MLEQVGRYEILEEIGQGGFAVVYRARDTVLERPVALKELKPVLLADTARVKRFQHEARLIARLDHPRIVTVYDVAEIDHRLFIVMRLVDGPSLAKQLAGQGPRSWPEAVEIVSAVAEGLDAAHARNILHRDLKPANILLDPERGPLLSDFGLAKLVGESSLSMSGDVLGTPHYLAPEGWEGQSATPQTDIYALGCILYELLMGEKVFRGDTPVAVMSAHLRQPELPVTWPEGVPAGVTTVLEKALARDPADRYVTAGELVRALNALDRPADEGQTQADDRLEIFTCGGLRLQRSGQPVTKIGSRRVEALLVYLACTGRPQPREVLADLLWDDRPQQQAMSNLRTVLTGLRKNFEPYVSISRDTVELKPGANIWLDLAEVTEKLAPLQTPAGLDSAEKVNQAEEAVALFQGEFLEGFYLRGALGFEEWQTVQREQLHQQVLAALAALVDYHLARGSFPPGLAHARQLLQLDPLLEEAHQQVMRLLAYSGQRGAALEQYETCRQLLAEEFGVEPAPETTALFEQIQAGTLEPPPSAPPAPPEPPPGPGLPPFLTDRPPPAAPPPLFVAREPELAHLNQHLARMLAGQGQVVFITGEAGRGKSALLAEFARRAQSEHPELIVVRGICNAYSGQGDPYLPFRDVLGMLTGEVEAQWAAGTVTPEHARRLWQLLPHTVQALIDEGPNLLDVFVPARGLIKRVTGSFPEQNRWPEQLQTLAEQAKTGAANLEQRQLFEQYTQVLHTLAARQPLLVLLDDLQWADSSSVNLLFHLVRRLQDSRILIVGAYRPSEVAAESEGLRAPGRRHPLEPVVREFKRLLGGIKLDLGNIPPAEGRAFVDALLDSEPNRLDEPFRAGLFRQAKGHALFTVELLRDMQERGDLVKDEDGQWIEGPNLDWQALPVRVEAIIEQRLGRLDEELQEILTVASVEGEVFSAQLVAQIQELGERQLLRRLSRELVRRHRLVIDQGEIEVGQQRVSRFQFRHSLFQQYLYDQLGPGERRLLHGEMAAWLEELYRDQTGEVAVQLARHYVEAGQGEQAIPYLLQAGDQARLAYAHEAAIELYRQAVPFLKEQGDDERAASTLMKLGLTYHNAFDFERSRQAYEEAFALRQETGPIELDGLSPAPPTLRIALPENSGALGPAMTKASATAGIIEQLFSGLVRLSPEMEVVPEVARSWQVLAEGRKYIFHLRDDVYWSDGVPVTAGDFEYAWKRALQPATGSPVASNLYAVKGARAFHQGRATDPGTVGVRAVGASTLEVELEEPTSYFLYLLVHHATYPVPQHLVAQFGPSWVTTERIVTNGPFRLAVCNPDGSLILERAPDYHDQFKGNVEQVEISVIKEEAARLEMYEADSLEMLDLAYFSPAEMEAIRSRYAGDYLSLPRLNTFYVEFDISWPPFADPRVRQAFVMAIDRHRWANEIERGFVEPAIGGFLPPGMPGHSADIGLPYDPVQARHLLAEAGFPDGAGFPPVDLLWAAVARAEVQCQHLQTQWRENLGVEVRWETLEFTALLDRLNKELPNLYIMGWVADYPDPDSFLRVAALQYKKTGWNDTYVRLVEDARKATDQQARLKLYQQADKMLVEEALIMPLYYERSHLLVKPWIRPFPTSALETWFWKDVIIDTSHRPVQSKSTTAPLVDSGVLTPSTLRTTAEGEPETLDPILCSDTTSGIIIDQLFKGLVTETPGMEFVPDLAQRWEILEDGRKYIFHLRSDVVWSDGAPVTATDFEYAWKRVLTPATGSVVAHLLYDLKGASAFHQGQVSDPDRVGVSSLDKHTLMVELERPASYFLNLLTCPTTFPVPQHVVEAHGEAWTDVENIVTNGPFTLEAWRKGEVMSLRRNRAYHGLFGGNVEQVEVFFSGDDLATELAWYEAGRLDVARLPSLKQEAKQQHSGEYISHPPFSTHALSIDKSRRPFDDPRVRRAFILACDRSGLLDTFTEIYGVPATGGLCPPGMPGHSAGIGLPYDPVQARQLLAEAGFPEGRNFPEIDWLVHEFLEPLAGYLQEQWQTNLGIHRFNKQSTSWGKFVDRAKQAQPAFLLWGWVADYPDPDNFLRVCLQHLLPGWRNEAFDRLVEQAGRMTDPRQRLELYRQADKILIEEVVLMPLTYGRYPLLVKPWVKQYVYAPHRRVFWQDVIIDPVQQPVRPKPAILKSPQSRTLRMALDAPSTLDPTMVDDWSIQNQLFSSLVEESPDLEIVPDVAQSWEISDGGSQYIFHLRSDVYWTDGRSVTAADFEYAWKRILDPAQDAPLPSLLYDLKGAKAYHQGQVPDAAEVGVRALDDVTLAVELEEPASYFLHLLAQDITFPVPRHAIAAHGEAWTAAEHIVTNGPFRVETWNWGQAAVLTRNPAYHGRFTGNVERVELKLSPWDTSANLREYQADHADVLYSSFSFPEIDLFRQQYPGEYVSLPWQQASYIAFDLSRPPFDDVRVRRAFALAIDKTRLASLPLGDEVVAATGGFIPVGLPGHSPGIAWPYDPAQARQLLTEAGYPAGQGFPQLNWLALTGEQMAEYLRQQWHDNLGLGLPPGEIVHMADFSDRFRQESPPLYLAGWVADYPDPDSFLRVAVLQNQQKIAGLRNEAYIELVEQARRVTDPETRLELYRQADKILVEEAFIIPLTYGRGHLLVKPWVKRYPTSPARWWFWKDVIIEPH